MSQASKTEIEANFEEVHRPLCDIHIIPPHSKLQDYRTLIGSPPEDRIRLGEILYSRHLTARELAQCLQPAEGDTLQPLGQVLWRSSWCRPKWCRRG